jgi:hypothetical protein
MRWTGAGFEREAEKELGGGIEEVMIRVHMDIDAVTTIDGLGYHELIIRQYCD